MASTRTFSIDRGGAGNLDLIDTTTSNHDHNNNNGKKHVAEHTQAIRGYIGEHTHSGHVNDGHAATIGPTQRPRATRVRAPTIDFDDDSSMTFSRILGT